MSKTAVLEMLYFFRWYYSGMAVLLMVLLGLYRWEVRQERKGWKR